VIKPAFRQAGEALCADSYRDLVVAASLVLPCLPAGREIANFL